MGFFSTRNFNGDSNFEDKSVAKVIQSRFYGTRKGKEREFNSTPLHQLRTSQSLPATRHVSKPKGINEDQFVQAGPSNPSRNSMVSTRTLTEAAPLTLAERLNELAVANAEGFIDDEEYRLLRQNLFERFTSGSSVPVESPVVPVAQSSKKIESQKASTSRSPLSFRFDPGKPPSVQSRRSFSGLAGLFRRPSTHDSPDLQVGDLQVGSETQSIVSQVSKTSKSPLKSHHLRAASQEGSVPSLLTDASRGPRDDNSITSHLMGSGSERNFLLNPSLDYRRSPSGLGRFATPPSSFRGVGGNSGHSHRARKYAPYEENAAPSAQEIRQEIVALEAEGRRLMDAFNGLEISTLTRKTPSQFLNSLQIPIMEISSSPPTASRRNPHRAWSDYDHASVLSSSSSAMTFPSSDFLSKAGLQSTHRSRPGSLRRKASLTSVSSSKNHNLGVPSTPSLSLFIGAGSSSNISFGGISALEDAQVLVADDNGGTALEEELKAIRQRRGEVLERYQAHSEYLKAKLKGAQLHEKLLK